MTAREIDLKQYIRSIPDWPKEGILFRDITPLLADAKALVEATDSLCADFRDTGIEYVAAVEARGFIFGTAVAEKLGAGFVPIRKKESFPPTQKASLTTSNTARTLWKFTPMP